MQSGTMRELFKDIGLDFSTMEINKPYPVNCFEIQTFDDKSNIVWKKVLNAVRKQNAPHMRVISYYNLTLDCSPDHRLFVKSKQTGLELYEEVSVLFKASENFELKTINGWETFRVENLKEDIEIADIEVEGQHSYLSNGILSHNTIYGDPSTTPGGMAIPYHASTRIKLTGGQQIKDTINGKEVVVGINVNAKTIKNKVARPWREVSFEIHFGKGIRESEQLFDELREFCEKCKDPVIVDGMKVKIDGGGSWKYFTVNDNKTGEIVHDLKFYKKEFQETVLNNPEVKKYIEGLMDAAFIMGNTSDNHKTIASIDLNSVEEVEAIKIEKGIKTGKNLLLG